VKISSLSRGDGAGAVPADVEMPGKRLHVFKKKVPALRRVAVLYNARGENSGHTISLALTRKVTPNLELKLTKQPSSNSA
jgi:hypothetical protein